MKRSIIMLLITVSLWTLGIDRCPRSTKECSYKAWIETSELNHTLVWEAFCQNNTPEDSEIEYELRAEKEGKSGKASTFQRGVVLIPSQEKKSLSKLSLTIAKDDHYQIELKVYKDKKIVAQDSISHP